MKDDVKEIMEKLEHGIKETMESEKWKNFLRVQSLFHKYSFNNAMLIYMQRPDATLVAGYQTWKNKFQRNVIRGEKGISILAPCPYKYEIEVEVKNKETGEKEMQKKTVEGIRFKKVTVFDVKQTEGKPLPEICNELQGNSVNSLKIINAIKNISDVPVVEKDIDLGKGYYNRAENIIVIKKDMSLDQTAKTLIHEYAHSQLHNTDETAILDKPTKEVQAESVAYIVANKFGIDTSEYSFEYLANWSSGKDLKELKESFNLIQKTASDIIEKIEKEIEKEMALQTNKEIKVSDMTVLEKVQEQYKDEYPAIKHISEKTAKTIDELNNSRGSSLSISEIKEMYNDAGKKIEGNYNKADMDNFKMLKDVVDDLKQAQLKEKQEAAQQKSLEKGLDLER
ncbi:MAG TPA: ArdC-like ssDNA-binding domain-containing protein [Sedimentibacter sp.]|nr:ArdC-like ssDNA-binding domain-containing protein [Sedimentibacter sp.]